MVYANLILRDYGMLAAIILKKDRPKLPQQLAGTGYQIVLGPDNPYLAVQCNTEF